MVPRTSTNRYGDHSPRDFKSLASADFATAACCNRCYYNAIPGFCQLGKSITAHLFSACQRHVARSIDKKRPGTLFNHRRRLYRLSAPVCCDTVGRKQNRNCHNHNGTRRYATLKRTNSRNALLLANRRCARAHGSITAIFILQEQIFRLTF